MYLRNFMFIYLTLWGLVKNLPMPFGNLFRWLVMKKYLKKMGRRVWVQDGACIWYPENISIGDYSCIYQDVFLNGAGGIEIGAYVMVAHHSSIISEDHGIERTDIPMRRQASIRAKVTIEDDVWIGAGVRILKGVTIGKGAIIGSNAVVTKDIPPYGIAVGIPARVVKIRDRQEETSQHPERLAVEAMEEMAGTASGKQPV